MRNCRPLFLLPALLLSVFSLLAEAQVTVRSSRIKVDSILNPALHSGADEILAFDKKSADIGTLHESDTVRVVKFAFRNVSDTAVTITKVTTHCGCTAAEFSKEPIAAGASSEIVIRYNPKGRYGTINTGALVYTDFSARRPLVKLTLLGNVIDDDEWSHLPYTMGDLKLKRKQTTFKNGRTVSRIPCANVGVKPLRLSADLLPQYATFATEPQVLQPGDEGDIVISINPELLPKDTTGTVSFSVIVNGVEGAPSSRTIKATIE